MEREVKYVTVSIPKAIADEIDFLIGELGYWPSRSSFVREACLEKIRAEKARIRELRESREVEASEREGKHLTSMRSGG